MSKERPDRPNATQRGYDWQWRKLRKLKLAHEPLCRICKANGVYVPATVVDHIKAKAQNEKAALYTLDELQSLCKPCHDYKTATQDNPAAFKPRSNSIFLTDIRDAREKQLEQYRQHKIKAQRDKDVGAA